MTSPAVPPPAASTAAAFAFVAASPVTAFSASSCAAVPGAGMFFRPGGGCAVAAGVVVVPEWDVAAPATAAPPTAAPLTAATPSATFLTLLSMVAPFVRPGSPGFTSHDALVGWDGPIGEVYRPTVGTHRRVVNAALDAPGTVAVTLNAPAIAFAVRIGDVAMPSGPVFTVTAPPNVTLGPLAGAAKVTATAGTAFPNASVTLACKVSVNGVRAGVDWSASDIRNARSRPSQRAKRRPRPRKSRSR